MTTLLRLASLYNFNFKFHFNIIRILLFILLAKTKKKVPHYSSNLKRLHELMSFIIISTLIFLKIINKHKMMIIIFQVVFSHHIVFPRGSEYVSASVGLSSSVCLIYCENMIKNRVEIYTGWIITNKLKYYDDNIDKSPRSSVAKALDLLPSQLGFEYQKLQFWDR